MARKKKTEETIIKEVSKLIAEETLQATDVPKKKSKSVVKEKEVWPKIIRGSHSTRTEYEDGSIEFVTHWDELVRDVQNALTEYENSVKVNAVNKTKRKTKNEA